ncbi:MAG: S41 family peptidase [Bacteroidia bacterium]
MMKNNLFRKAFQITLPLLIVAGGYLSLAIGGREDHQFEISKNMEIFGTLYQQLNKLYVDEPKPGQLMKTGIDAMLASLDPYTNYITEEEIEDYKIQISGHYGGVGVQVRIIDGEFVVAEPYEGFAAHKAGIKAGDIIQEVNGNKIKGKTFEQVGKLMKGVAGSPVKVKILRPGETEPREYDLLREEVKVKNVTHSTLLENNTGYIRLSNFMENAGVEVRQSVLDLKEKGATSFILDLRGNPGGLLQEAVNIVNCFVERGQLIVSMKGRVREWDKQFRTSMTPVDTKVPLVVLTDEHSASASEIVAGSLQDLDRAVVVGQRSFGKGLVQQTVPLVYNSMLKVTIAKYYTPSGRCVQSLDYSHRDANGVSRVPDSLITAFKTKNGRTVWDGLGVIPDIELPGRTYSVLADTLMKKGIIFNYATEYARKHASIAAPDQFTLSDTEYDEFVKWAAAKNVKYVTPEEKALKQFKKNADQSGAFNTFSADYTQLSKKLEDSKADDFVQYKSEIKVLLESEIASRYYYQQGRVAASLRNDPVMTEAMGLLKNTQKLNSILTTVVVKEKPRQRSDMEKKDEE